MAEQAEGEFNLRDLNDQELTEQVHDDLYNGLKVEVEEATRLFRARLSAEKTLNDALVEWHAHRRHRLPRWHPFVPEVLLAANSMKGGMEIPVAAARRDRRAAHRQDRDRHRQGDIHDIGKNLVSMMLEGAGFGVTDLGITIRSRSTWRPSRSTSPTSSACRRC